MPSSMINPRRRGAPAPSPPQPEKGYPQAKKDPIALKETINNPFKTAKAATNVNHRLCLKSKPQVKCH